MAFKGEMKPCFAVLVPRLKEKLLEKGVMVSHTLSGDLVSAYPSHFASDLHRVFLKAGCKLQYIPCGRSARKSTSPDTVFKRALYVSKAVFDAETLEVLEEGK